MNLQIRCRHTKATLTYSEKDVTHNEPETILIADKYIEKIVHVSIHSIRQFLAEYDAMDQNDY